MSSRGIRAALLCSVAAFGVGLAAAPSIASAEEATGAVSAADFGEIVGTVTDAGRGGYLVGAEVRVVGLDLVAVTDREGRFVLRRVPAGAHRLMVSYVGRESHEVEAVAVIGRTTTVDASLGAESDASQLDEVVVVGARPIAESEAAALQMQRASTSLVSIVAADAIGRFPDQNVAAALSRLPGIAVQRDQGQERFVNLRGSPDRWTTIAFDGVNVVSPAGRTARLDTIPAAIASSVQARKAITAAMPGETVAGNINIITRSAFDYSGFKAAGDFGIGYNDLGGGEQYTFGGFISDTFADGKFGVLLSASQYVREMVTDNFETDWEVAAEDDEPGGAGRIWADAHQNKLYRLTRTNTSYTGRFDYRPSDDHRFFLSTIYTEFTDDEHRNAMEFDFDQNAIATSNTDTQLVSPRTGYADIRTGNTPLQGTVYATELDSTLNYNTSVQSIFTTTLGGDQRFGEWGATWRLNYTNAHDKSGPSFNSTWVSPPSDRLARPTVVYDFTDRELHGVQLFETLRNPDGSYAMGAPKRSLDSQDYQFVSFASTDRDAETDSFNARLDLNRDIDLFGLQTTLQFGGQFDQRTKENNQTTWQILPAAVTAQGLALPTMADISIDEPYKGQLPLGYVFRYFSKDAGYALFNSLIDAGAGRIQPGVTEANYYKVQESVLAGYAMTTTYFDWGNVVAGLRVEQTENTGEALVDQGAGYQPIEVSNDEVNVFPSVHLNWDLNDEMKVRFSVNTGAARPDYTDLRPNFSVNDTDEEIDGGNPYAGPEKSLGFDAYFEWYMKPQGYLSVGFYYKDLRDILFDVEIPDFGSDVLNGGGVDRSAYTYFTLDNGGDGFIRGFEASYAQQLEPYIEQLGLPDWVGGFGLQANVTLNETEATTPDGRTVGLPGASDLVYNTSLYYERYGFSSRISWQYRSEWLDSIGDGGVMGDSYWNDTARLDFSARYSINDNAEIYLDANNLLDEPGVRYQGEQFRTTEYERFGSRYMIGMRLNF